MNKTVLSLGICAMLALSIVHAEEPKEKTTSTTTTTTQETKDKTPPKKKCGCKR